MTAWNRFASEQSRRERNSTREILDTLRHAHVENGKYLVTLLLRSGRLVTGFIGGDEEYEHSEYHAGRGFIRLALATERSRHVHYETVLIRLSEIEGCLIQNIYGYDKASLPELVGNAARCLTN